MRRKGKEKRVGEVWGGHPWIDIVEKTRGRPVSKKSRTVKRGTDVRTGFQTPDYGEGRRV